MANDFLQLLKDEAAFSAKLFYAPVYGTYRILRTSVGRLERELAAAAVEERRQGAAAAAEAEARRQA